MRTRLFYTFLFTLTSCTIFIGSIADQNPEIPLWPQGAPGSAGLKGEETISGTEGAHIISNVHSPSLTPFIPVGNNTGAAVIIAPGGGHRYLSIDQEGYNPARWLQQHGIAAFVLKYRLANQPGSGYSVEGTEVGDIQRAIRLVRSRAVEWNIDGSKIGLMGFSAGGQLAGFAGARQDDGLQLPIDQIDKASSKIAFHALMYPGNSDKFSVNKNSPPSFIACGYNDPRAEALMGLFIKYKASKIPAELHIYSKTGHGFGYNTGMKNPPALWPEQFLHWMSIMKFIKQ